MPITGFHMKSFGQIVASLVNWFSSAQDEITDLNVGSVARTLLEASASEISEMYFRIFKSIDEAQAEAVYRSFGFDRKPASFAAGVVFWRRTTLPTSVITIPGGSQAAVPATGNNPEITFSSSVNFVIPIATTLNGGISDLDTTATLTTAADVGVGDVLKCEDEQMQVTSVAGAVVGLTRGFNSTTPSSHADTTPIGVVAKAVTMTADLAGASGNVGAATITKINTAILGITSVTNPAALSGGSDEETDDARKKRFQDFVTGLARGTKGAIEFGAKLVPGVVSAKAIDLDDDISLLPGYVDLFIADAAGTADAGLIAAVDLELNNWRPAGVSVTTAAPTLVPIDVTVTLAIESSFNPADVREAVRQRIVDHLTAHTMGDDVFLALLYQVIVDTNPVAVLNANISTPSGDTSIDPQFLARPGTITVS